jgi:hypothetical protein
MEIIQFSEKGLSKAELLKARPLASSSQDVIAKEKS